MEEQEQEQYIVQELGVRLRNVQDHLQNRLIVQIVKCIIGKTVPQFLPLDNNCNGVIMIDNKGVSNGPYAKCASCGRTGAQANLHWIAWTCQKCLQFISSSVSSEFSYYFCETCGSWDTIVSSLMVRGGGDPSKGWVNSIIVRKDLGIRHNSISGGCPVCGGTGKVNTNINCSHGKSASHWHCSHGTAQSANYHT